MPADYVLGIIQKTIASGIDQRITLPGNGEIIILARRGMYLADVKDMAEFCIAPSVGFSITKYRGSTSLQPPLSWRAINHLLWDAAFHGSQGRLIQGCTKFDIIKLNRWPNLTRLAITPNAARICALLIRNRTTIELIRRILNIEDTEVYQICSAAHSAGIANMVLNLNPISRDIKPEPKVATGLFRAIFAKISGL